jgi:predicted Zn-dependent peptidase
LSLPPLRAIILRDWYKRYYAPNNATLVVVGDVWADEVIALAKKYFGIYTTAYPKHRHCVCLSWFLDLAQEKTRYIRKP